MFFNVSSISEKNLLCISMLVSLNMLDCNTFLTLYIRKVKRIIKIRALVHKLYLETNNMYDFESNTNKNSVIDYIKVLFIKIILMLFFSYLSLASKSNFTA